MHFNIINGIEYITINALAKEFGIGHQALQRNLEYQGIKFFHYANSKYIEKKFFDEYQKECKWIIGFKEIVKELAEKLNSNVNSKSLLHLYKLITYVSGNNYFGVYYISSPVYKINDSLNFYIYKKDRKTLEDGITEFLLLFNKANDVKVNLLCDDTAFDNKKITVKCIKQYINYVDKRTLSAFVESVNFLRLTLKKDLSLYTDEEISDYSKFASKEMTKTGCSHLIGLYTYMQKNMKCKSNVVLQFKNKPEKNRDTSPYDAEKYLKLAYMIFNEEYWKKHNMIHKAVTRERYAKIWFFHAMHYICDWRSNDIIGEIPRIILDRLPEQILKEIESGNITEAQYRIISEEIAIKVNYKPKKPSKIRRHKNAPPLRLYIPESFSTVIGMLAMVCEAHNQIKGKKSALCHMSSSSLDAESCINFFGDEYKDLFDGSRMSNRRANKSHMTMLSDTGNELSTDGYLIASFARSHTGGINKIPDVTSRYLQAKMDGYSVREITRVLFERGVCSFIPYLFCSVLKKEEFEKAGIKEQTLVMSNLPMKAFDIESLLKIDDTIAINTKQKVAEVIKWANEDNISELIREALKSIITGECTGKNEGVYCLRKACGKECSEKCRETCVGCGYEMYIKAFLMELHNEIKFQEHSLNMAKTQGEKIKRTAILEKKLYPTVCELLTTIKYVYGQNIEEFKMLFSGVDENGNARIR